MIKTRPYPRENKNQWDFKPHRHEYAGKIHIDEVWWHKYAPVFVTVNHAWLGKGHMRNGYVIDVKRTGSKVKVRSEVAYTKKHALEIAKKFRFDINKYPACQCSCDKCFSGSHCHGLVCRGD